jgi:catechol 2,3-dioxygenase-like lactoylglutathione lyase family enzyme
VEPRVDVITLAVEDLERALRFYRDGLGFESRGIIGTQWTDEESGANGAIAVFQFESGLLLSLYPRSDLAKDAAIPAGPARPGEFSLGQLVQSRAEVDDLIKKAKAAGRPSPRRATGRGASTPATSATWTATFGRSSGTRMETDLARPRVTFAHAARATELGGP